MRRRTAALATFAGLTTLWGCGPVVRTTLFSPEVRRVSVCREGVAVFFDSAAVQRPYDTVASLDVGWGPDVGPPTFERLIAVLQKSAAKLGANGVIVGAGWRDIPHGVQPSLAILVPADTGRVRAACSGR